MSKFKIRCLTEGMEYDNTFPKCPRDTNHIVVVDIVNENINVLIKEETGGETNGRYACRGENFVAVTNTTTNHQISANYKTSTLSFIIQATDDMVGDTFEYRLGEGTVIGVCTANVSVGATEIPYIGGAYPGLYIDGCKISAVSPTKLTLETPITQVYSQGDTLTGYRCLIEHYYISIPGFHKIGFAKIGGGIIPENTIGNLVYKNNSLVNKRIAYSIEYYY